MDKPRSLFWATAHAEAKQTPQFWYMAGRTDKTSISPEYLKIALSVLAMACLPIGVFLDTSWHISIGRDTFWTPAHIIIQLGGVVPALIFAWQAAITTFSGTPEQRSASVSFWGARASFGAWVTLWGALAMLTSAPFDNWWHNAYGLDVRIASVPHAVLGFGMLAVGLGVLLSVLPWRNRLDVCHWPVSYHLFVLASGLLITLLSFYITQFTRPNQQHSARFYNVISCAYPFLFVAIARASRLRAAASFAALIYMGIMLTLVWVLPLFPAQPRLAPIYNPVNHMVPPPFPMLLIIPAMGIDLLMRLVDQRSAIQMAANEVQKKGWRKSPWVRDSLAACAVGVTFLFSALSVQWLFATFLLSPAADNWFFAGNRFWPYFVKLGEWTHQFWDTDTNPISIRSLILAAINATVSARFGLWCGTWMLRVKR